MKTWLYISIDIAGTVYVIIFFNKKWKSQENMIDDIRFEKKNGKLVDDIGAVAFHAK